MVQTDACARALEHKRDVCDISGQDMAAQLLQA